MSDARTPDQIREQAAHALDLLRRFSYADEFAIDDYPLGRSDRGRCVVGVERKPGYGYRIVRTTENPKTGRLNKPHKGQYVNPGFVLVARDACRELQRLHPDFVGAQTFVGWVQVDSYGVHLRRASYDSLTIFQSVNRGYAPRTESKEYSVGGETRVMEPDPPELVAAFAAWREGTQPILDFVKAVREDVKNRAAEPAA